MYREKEHTHEDSMAANVCLTLCLIVGIALGTWSGYSLIDGVQQKSVQRVNEIEGKIQDWQRDDMANF